MVDVDRPRAEVDPQSQSQPITVDFLILADAVQVQGDKLFMLGGGWSFIQVAKFPAAHLMGVAAGVLVPWLEANRSHQFSFRIRNEDGHQNLIQADGTFEQGRPPGTPHGTTQRVLLALNFALSLDRPGQYVAELEINGTLATRQPFRVLQAGARSRS